MKFHFYRLVPNVGLEDESPSSKSDGSPEEDRSCGDPEGATTDAPEPVSTTPPPEPIEPNRSPRHQTFNGERRRRKLPEIPKNRKCKCLII